MINFRRTVAAVLLALSFTSALDAHAQIPLALGEGQQIPSLAPLLKAVTPSVVIIAVRRRMTQEELDFMNDPLFQDPLGSSVPPTERNIYAAGSGVIIDGKEGFIVTGGHVVDGADEIVVVLPDGRRLAGTRVGLDTQTDIAVVKVLAKKLISMQMGDSDKLEVGDFVLAIGNPFSLGQTVTSGIVSALRRRSLGPRSFEDFIQTDAAINLGSSGGALVNLRGELVGLNAAILDTGGPGGSNNGIGFAIPVNIVKGISNQLMKYGSASHGQLGVTVLAQKKVQGAAPGGSSGVVITQVDPGSSAALAGLKVGDTIRTLNGSPLREPADLYIKTGVLRVGEFAELEVVRGGQVIAVRATLESRTAPLREQ